MLIVQLTNTSERVTFDSFRGVWLEGDVGAGKAYAYVSPRISAEFNGYARACGLTSQSELLKLLIERELRLRRLARRYPTLNFHRRSPSNRGAKITAHLPAQLDERFATHTDELGLSTSCAAALLVETELEERWLATAIEWEPVQ